MKTVEELKQMHYELTRKMGEYLECLAEWNSYIEEHDREDGKLYQKGLEDAWEMMRDICFSPYEGGMESYELVECFGSGLVKDILRTNSASEAKAKYDAWKEKKKSAVRVGDLIHTKRGDEDMVVTGISGSTPMYHAVNIRYGTCTLLLRNEFVTTGKHYDLPWVENETD